MIVLNDTLGAFGGSHTLFLRMCEWYTKNGIRVSFFCNSRDNQEISDSLEAMGVCIYVIDTTRLGATYKLLQEIDDGDLRVINFWWDRYLNIEAIKYRYKVSFENVIYLIHPKCMIKGEGYSHKFPFINHAINMYRDIIIRMCTNGAIVSMDEINIAETENYYGIKMNPVPLIIRLPMKVESVDKDKVIREGFQSKIIMTSARADFPFKGYVIGLIDTFVCLKKNFPEIKLLLVCDGEDREELYKKIAAVPEEYKQSIKVYNWMNYSDLKREMEKAFVFVGMGSSVTDSSLRYKPSLVIRAFTRDCIGESFTADNPIDLCARECVSTPAAEPLKKILSMNFDDYKSISEKSYLSVKAIYGEDVVMPQMMNYQSKIKQSVLNKKSYCLIRTNNFINKIRFGHKLEKNSVKHLAGNTSLNG